MTLLTSSPRVSEGQQITFPTCCGVKPHVHILVKTSNRLALSVNLSQEPERRKAFRNLIILHLDLELR